jgi:LysM repeat protein
MKSHVVKSGETLSKIALKHNKSIEEIQMVNPQIMNIDELAIGQVIHIPEDPNVAPAMPEPDIVTGIEVNESVTKLLRRARQVLNKGIKYDLGAGGMIPTMTTPANLKNACDCSGFVCWCFRISRKTRHPLYMKFNGGWINTDAIVHDARKETGFFRLISTPRIGCVVVFPGPPLRKIGHVGIVTEVNNAGTIATKVIHCSNGNYRRTRDSIQETDPNIFKQPDTIFAWYEGIDD